MAGQIKPIIQQDGLNNCNDAKTGYYSFVVAPDNAPSSDGGILICINKYPMIMQMYLSDAYGLYYLHKWYSN